MRESALVWHNMNIILIGYRAVGKTTVARLLAEKLNYPCIDSDDEVERRAEKSIKQIFAEKGEPAFRALEAAVVADLMRGKSSVVSLGGGAVLLKLNRLFIAGRGIVFWLQADAATIYDRISSDPLTGQRRPNLTAAGGFDEIRQLLAEREPIYRECADFEIDTTGKSVSEVADEILNLADAHQSSNFGTDEA